MIHGPGPDRLLLAAVFAFSAAGLSAQPRIDQVQNNYSYLLPANPNYGIAQGSILIIKGANLANTTTALQNTPLKTTLEGVTARVTVGAVTTDVIWYYVTPAQLGGILPSSTPAGTGTITVTNNGQTSAAAPIVVVQSAFGVLTLDGSGTGRAAVHDGQYSLLSSSNSTKPGDAIVFYGTGAGPVSADETVPQTPADLSGVPISVEIGGVAANVLYHGRTEFPGLDQINVVVPPGVTFGCNVPVAVKSGALSSNNTTIPVSAGGGTCTTPAGGGGDGGGIEISQAEIDRWLASGQFRTGGLGLTRSTSHSINENPAGGALTTQVIRSDVFTATFSRITGPDLSRMFNSQYAVPAAGACIVTQSVTNPFPGLVYTSLDAGPSLSATGPSGSRTAVRKNAEGMIVYGPPAGAPETDLYLVPGQYAFTGAGGPDVGSFSGTITVAPDLVWTNVSDLTVVNRNTPLTVTWSGGEPSALVTIQGQSFVAGASGAVTGAAFTCYARNTDRTFTVPTAVLGQLPASAKIAAGPISITLRGSLAVASTGKGARMQAAGLDYLTAGNQWGIAQTTEYR